MRSDQMKKRSGNGTALALSEKRGTIAHRAGTRVLEMIEEGEVSPSLHI